MSFSIAIMWNAFEENHPMVILRHGSTTKPKHMPLFMIEWSTTLNGELHSKTRDDFFFVRK